MAKATEKSGRATIVKQDKVGLAETFLKELPEKSKEDMSLRAAVNQLQEPLKEALSKGYSYADLAKMLTEQGIKISTLTLKNYLPSGKRSSTKGRTRRPKKNQSEAAVVSSPEEQPEAAVPETKSRRRTKPKATAATEATEPTSPQADETPAKKPARRRTKATTVAKTRTESRAKAKQSPSASPAARSTTKTPTRSRRRKTNG